MLNALFNQWVSYYTFLHLTIVRCRITILDMFFFLLPTALSTVEIEIVQNYYVQQSTLSVVVTMLDIET